MWDLRKILLTTDKLSIDNIDMNDAESIEYHNLVETDLWKVSLIQELTDVKFGEAHIENLTTSSILLLSGWQSSTLALSFLL